MASFRGVAEFPEIREKAMDCKRVEEKDYFKEIPIRYLGYANEVGEAFRNMIPLRGVHLSYAISTAYVVSHAVSQGLQAQRNRSQHPQHIHVRSPNHSIHCPTNATCTAQCSHRNNTRTLATSPSTAVIDTLLWQGLASVLLPGLTINRLCAVSRFVLNRYTGQLLSVQIRKWAVTGIGLGSIPLIIHPIDSAVDSFMNFCVRPVLRT